MKTISRRDFLKGAIAGTATVAAFGFGSGSAFAADAIYTPGTYSAKANGMGEVIVTMTFSESAITDVVLDLSGETPSIGGAPETEEALKAAIMAAQSGEIDAVSGASITSLAVKKAATKCIQQAKGEIPVEVIETKKAENGDASTDWLGAEPVISDAEIAEEYETEILVIGCGTGGMFTICSAAEEGAKVIGIDRSPSGGSVRNDIGGANSRYQKEWGTEIDKFDFITMATEYAAGNIDQRLVAKWYDNSGAVVDWYGDRLSERGVELWHESGDTGDVVRYPHIPIGHSPRWTGTDDGNGNPLNGNIVLHDYAVSKGAEFHYSTSLVKLNFEGGRVTGCIAKNEDDKFVRYTATKGTVVCTGGYAGNWSMLETLQPETLQITGSGGSGNPGDGIKACLWVGAAMDETHLSMLFDRAGLRPDQDPGPETMKAGGTGNFWIGSQAFLKVNADGDRFFNESGTYDGILHADRKQKGHAHYTIFDANWETYCEQFKMHGCARIFPFENGADPQNSHIVVKEKFIPQLLEQGILQQADTIEELAEKLLLPVDEFKATVEHYNQLCYAGEDTDFGKEPHRLTPVDTAPFYGCKNAGTMLCTLDGIKIDPNCNALNKAGHPIPGLYVNGNDSGCYFANSYPNLSTGMACGRTVTFGYLIGKDLAK